MKQVECLSLDTYRCMEATLLYSGYHTVPNRKMLWEQKMDCYNQLISSSIRRGEMDACLKWLHFRDNSKMNNDAFFKVRPLFNNFNKEMKHWNSSISNKMSEDKAMLPYFGRHGVEQFINGKPIRYHFKIWAM